MHDRDKDTEQLNNDELAECKSLSQDAEAGSFTLEDILAEYGTRRSTQRSAVPVSAPAARAAADFDIDVLLVIRVAGQQQDFQLVLKPRDVVFRLLKLLLRKLLHLRVGQHFGRVRLHLLRLFVLAVRRNDGFKLVSLAQQPRRAVRVVV